MGAERAVSLLSAQAVTHAFKELNIPYHVLECSHDIASKLSLLKPKAIFLAVHGQYAEDGTLQGLLEYLKIPYTGSGVLSSALCMNKCVFKDFISQYKIPTPSYQNLHFTISQGIKNKANTPITFNKKTLGYWNQQTRKNPEKKISKLSLSNCQAININQALPFVVKPARAGSTLGISICKKKADIVSALEKALKYDHKILLENYIKGQELAFSYLNGKVLTPVEVVAEAGFYDYKSKYQSPHTQYILPPKMDKTVLEKGRKIALKAFKLTQVRTYSRADFIVQNNKKPLITEINTLPGLTKKSLFPKSANYDGISFNNLIKQILQKACLDYPY